MLNADACFFLRKRYFVCFLSCLGVIVVFILRTNLSITIVEMTTDKKMTTENGTIIRKAEFDWDSKTRGLVLSVFSAGYLFGPFGGILGAKFGGATIFGAAILSTAVLTVLSPFLFHVNLYAYILARICEGLFESFSMACVPEIFLQWAPPNERSRLLTLSSVGSYLGAAANYLLSGYVAFEYGWEAVFYVTGAIGLIWYAIWIICIVDDPTSDPLMTKKEKDYIRNCNLDHRKNEKIIYPWRKIFASKAMWAFVNESFCYCWLYSFIVYCLPLYITEVYAVNINTVSLLSGIPIVVGGVGMVVASFVSDYLRSLETFSKTSLHRAFVTTGQLFTVVCVTYVGLWANFEQSIIGFSLARFFASFAEMSYYVMVIDMFGEYAGLIRGFSLSASSLSYFLNPLIMGFFVSDHTRDSWNMYFLFLNVFNVWSLIIFYVYGFGGKQEWTVNATQNETDEGNPAKKNDEHP